MPGQETGGLAAMVGFAASVEIKLALLELSKGFEKLHRGVVAQLLTLVLATVEERLNPRSLQTPGERRYGCE